MKLSQTLFQSTAMVRTFGKDEDGAVTVDWVVLTAAVVGLGIAVLGTVTNGSLALSGKMSGTMDSFDFGGNGGGGAGGGGNSGGGSTLGGMQGALFSAYYDAYGGDADTMSQAITADAPAGFSYTGHVDPTSGAPIYQNDNQYSINGTVMDQSHYDSGGQRPFSHDRMVRMINEQS